jgi:hypothetical protein
VPSVVTLRGIGMRHQWPQLPSLRLLARVIDAVPFIGTIPSSILSNCLHVTYSGSSRDWYIHGLRPLSIKHVAFEYNDDEDADIIRRWITGMSNPPPSRVPLVAPPIHVEAREKKAMDTTSRCCQIL